MDVVINGIRYVPGTVEKGVVSDLASCQVVKTLDERRYSLGVAYPAMKADSGIAADGFQDFISPEALEKTAWEWMTKRRNINLFHEKGTDGHAEVVESYIYRGPDWTICSPIDGQDYIVKAGDWMLGTVWDQIGWALVKDQKVRGWSPEGGARRIKVDTNRLEQLRD